MAAVTKAAQTQLGARESEIAAPKRSRAYRAGHHGTDRYLPLWPMSLRSWLRWCHEEGRGGGSLSFALAPPID